MNKAGTNIGMGQWMATLAIQPVIQTLLLVRLALQSCTLRLLQGYPIGITGQSHRQLYRPAGYSDLAKVRFLLPAEMPDVIRLAQAQYGSMPTQGVPTSFFGHFMRQPIIDSVSRSTALLPGVP